MRIIKINSVMFIIEGLLLLGVCIYWSTVYPEGARVHLLRWTWSRDVMVGFVVRAGLVLLTLGCVGYIVSALVPFIRSLGNRPGQS
jgi:hypothetical protein